MPCSPFGYGALVVFAPQQHFDGVFVDSNDDLNQNALPGIREPYATTTLKHGYFELGERKQAPKTVKVDSSERLKSQMVGKGLGSTGKS